jgi:hypothetical protein
LRKIRSVYQSDIAAERHDFLHYFVATDDIDGFQTQQFRDRDRRAPDARIGTILDHPRSRAAISRCLLTGDRRSADSEIMSFNEIVEEVSKLTGEERDALRSYLDQYEAMENDAIDEGLRSLKEEPTITFEELDRRISEKFGWK